jgi:hypothetical protein
MQTWLNKKRIHTSVPLDSKIANNILSQDLLNAQLTSSSMGLSSVADQYISFDKIWAKDVGQDRLSRYNVYDEMDKTMELASRALNVYAAEICNTGFINDALQIESDNKDLLKFLNDIFKRNNIFQRFPADTRQLVKYGDFAYIISGKREYDDRKKVGKNTLPLRSDEILLTPRPAKYWEIETDKSDPNKILYYKDLDRYGNNVYFRWNFIQFSVFDYDFFPYGRGLLESIGINFERLNNIETLVAMARASAIDKYAVYVKVNESNPSIALEKLQTIKTQMKNVMMTNSDKNSTNSYNKIGAINEQIFVPMDQFKIDKLSTKVNIGEPEDAKYFQDQAFSATGLLRSFFLNDGSNNEIHGGALKEQYSFFARQLQPFTKAMLNGYMSLAEMLAVLGGFDSSKKENKFKIIIREPISYKKDIIELYADTFEKIINIVDKYKDLLGDDVTIKIESMRKLCGAFGVPEQITAAFLNVFKKDDDIKDLKNSKDSVIESGNNTPIYELKNPAKIKALLEETVVLNAERRESLEKLGLYV